MRPRTRMLKAPAAPPGRRRLHQPLPLVNVFAHEHLIGRRRGDDAVGVLFHAAGDAEAAVHVDPLVLEAGKPALDLLEVREIVDLAEIRELLLRAHAQRIHVRKRVAERTVLIDHGGAVPDDIGLIDRDRLEHLDVVAEQRQVRKHVDVDRLR